jgi:hypothetical protein
MAANRCRANANVRSINIKLGRRTGQHTRHRLFLVFLNGAKYTKKCCSAQIRRGQRFNREYIGRPGEMASGAPRLARCESPSHVVYPIAISFSLTKFLSL